ncbi:hypothetical protein TNCV_3283121 [Trichonephila clavipes]|nr:hypothetical protein TNCV_3283121 [Trichonephila clavipes]
MLFISSGTCSEESLEESKMDANENSNCLLSLANATDSDCEDEVVNDLYPVDFYVVTRMPVESYKFRWTLNQFDKLSIEKKLYSPYICQQNADFTLVVRTEEIRVNRSILAARSPVFKKMFDYDKEHHVRCSAAIPDVSLPAMKRLVEFFVPWSC